MIIRNEEPKDYQAVETLTRKAFYRFSSFLTFPFLEPWRLYLISINRHILR